MEAAGDIATGALIGRAIEPRAGEGGHPASAHGLCLNCGTALIGDYCHACGQNGHVHRSLGSIGHDLLHGVFHFEGKIWRTLPMLVLQPGTLTRRYIAGERARFVSPLAMFLFFVFLMFATLHAFTGEIEGTSLTPQGRAQLAAKLDAEIARTSVELSRATARDAARPGSARDAIADLRTNLAALRTTRATMFGDRDDDFDVTKLKTGWPALDHGIKKAGDNPGLMLYKLQSSAYKYSWALIPISTPFVALLFLWRRRFQLYDHAIFVTYSLAFMMLLVTFLTLLERMHAPDWMFGMLLLFAPPVHMFAQLRGAYSLRKRAALWRTALLLSFAWLALAAFIVLLLLMGLTG